MSVRVLTPVIQSGATGAIEVSAPKGTYLRLAERHASETRFERMETVVPESDGRFVHRFMTSTPTTAAYEVQFGGGGPYVWPGCPVPFFDGATYGQRLVIEAATARGDPLARLIGLPAHGEPGTLSRYGRISYPPA